MLEVSIPLESFFIQRAHMLEVSIPLESFFIQELHFDTKNQVHGM